jgi:hypothetical protein
MTKLCKRVGAGMNRVVGAAAILMISCWLLAALPARAETFTTGITDPVYGSAARGAWLDRTVAAGAQFVLLPVVWGPYSPQPAAGTDPSDPANPAYDFGALDATVRAATARGLTVVLDVEGGAPEWAEGSGRLAAADPGSWWPNSVAYADFARAVARRYSGGFNPGTGVLPRVRYYQAWAEPNLPFHLTPQWVRADGRWIAESPIIYRSLLNAFYAAVKGVHSSNVVITGGVAPFGDPPGGNRMPPAVFVRDLLCLSRSLAPRPCPDPAHFDVLAADPYSFAAGLGHASQIDNVMLSDMGKLTGALAAAERSGRALPRIHHDVWVTEFGWESQPPDPHGVPLLTRARWIEQAFYVLWREGVDTATWYLIVDQSPTLSLTATWQTGLYYQDGRRKPYLEAFRFPFLAKRLPDGQALVWGVSPDAGTVLVQVQRSGRWTMILRQRVSAHEVFNSTISLPGRSLLRAQVGADTSMGWQL